MDFHTFSSSFVFRIHKAVDLNFFLPLSFLDTIRLVADVVFDSGLFGGEDPRNVIVF